MKTVCTVFASCIIVMASLESPCRASPQTGPKGDDDLIVMCDVSSSLTPALIEQEADDAFRFIKDERAFPGGRYRIYIADRDVEQNLADSGRKLLLRHDDERWDQSRRLDARASLLKEKLRKYCRTVPSRDRTCLVQALGSVKRLFSGSVGEKKVLILSDMLEDCGGEGDPKSLGELRHRIARSLKEDPLAALPGVQVFASVIRSPLTIGMLDGAWQDALATAKVRLSLGTLQTLLDTLPDR